MSYLRGLVTVVALTLGSVALLVASPFIFLWKKITGND